MDEIKYLVAELRELRKELKRVFEKMDSLNESSYRHDERINIIEKRQEGYRLLLIVTPVSIIIGLMATQFFNIFMQNLFK